MTERLNSKKRICPICGHELGTLQYSDWLCCDHCQMILPEDTWRSKEAVQQALDERMKLRNTKYKLVRKEY